MKNLFFLFIFLVLTSCGSIAEYNRRLETEIAPEKLRKDISFAYHKLQKLHPNLYWYISQDSLDGRFRQLQDSMTTPLTPAGFYRKAAPTIASVREGHLRLIPPSRKYTRKEMRKLKNQKGLFGRMNYVVDSNRIFVKDNADRFENIRVGTQILEIDGIPAENYLMRYRHYITGDGYNRTFVKYALAGNWPVYFTMEKGILDSVKIKTLLAGEAREFYIHREKKTQEEKKEEKKTISEIRKSDTGKNKDYNPIKRAFNRDLQFLDPDSTVAYMKIRTFSGVRSSKFYRESFSKIKKKGTQTLILDVRDNLGGSLSEIHNLYSYLASGRFRFINDIEINSRFSLLHADYLSEYPTLLKPVGVITYPLYSMGMLLSTKKNNGRYYLRNNNIFTIRKPRKNAFCGKIYLLINGSSFSASSVLASKLKDAKRAVLVGEETGGANDGTVAGRYSTEKLPASGLYLPIGLMLVQPDIRFSGTGKGVIPDVQILPTLRDILAKKDIQLQWILNQIPETRQPQ